VGRSWKEQAEVMAILNNSSSRRRIFRYAAVAGEVWKSQRRSTTIERAHDELREIVEASDTRKESALVPH